MKKYLNFHTLKSIIILVLLLGGWMSCDSNNANEKYEKIPDAEPILLDLKEKIETDNAFAIDLFKATYKQSEVLNLFVSPLSVNMALSMTLNGAKGATLEEIKKILNAKEYSLDDINIYNRSLREALMKVDPSTTLSIANSIWYHNTTTIRNEFISVNKNNYDAEIKSVDFNSSSAVKQINEWVSNQTNNKISEIIKELSANNKMCLINAVYFKGVWKSKFDKGNTKNEDFYLEDNVVGKANMMSQTGNFSYSEDDNCRYLKMSYGNWAFSMIVLLPNDGKTVDDVISNLNSKSWNDAMMMELYEVNLRIPRFKVECDYEMVNSILLEMGVHLPFSEDADFSGIAEEQSFKISQVIHKTFIDVNEEGVEAAVATDIGLVESAPPPGTVIDYVVNKPFAFAIRENSTGIILFMGKIGHVK